MRRRAFLGVLAGAAAAAALATKSAAQPSAPASIPAHLGPPMTSVEPFDAAAVLTRNGTTPHDRPYVESVIAIEQENHQVYSEAAPLFVEGHATDNPQANVGGVTAMDTTATFRGYNPGKSWDAAVQAEEYDGPGTTGTTIALGVEAARTSYQGEMIGVNIHNDSGRSLVNGNAALQIQGDGRGSWNTGVKIAAPEQTDIELDGNSTRGIWLAGKNTVGIDAGQNSIRVSAGTPLLLDDYSQAAIRENPDTHMIEITWGGQVLGYLDPNGKRGVRLN